MASRSNKKTTMSKLAREHKLRERRVDKKAKKDARKQASSIDAPPQGDTAVADESYLSGEPASN